MQRRVYPESVMGEWDPQELQELGYELVETHISRVFMTDRDVFKTKRPVALGFLNYATLAMRADACRAEVLYNRRLAPDVYLEVVALMRDDSGQLCFRGVDEVGSDAVLEWAVHMRRLPDRQRADVLMARGDLSPLDIDELALLLARFHREARSDAEVARSGSPERIRHHVEENFAQTERSAASYLDPEERATIVAFQRRFIERNHALLVARAAAGRTREGHGDLRLEHCYRGDDGRFVVIDCIEFNDQLRCGDVCADLAFLAMDLSYHGRVDLAERLVATYARDSCDYELYAVLAFYESYRAVVRAKVSSILADDPGVSEASRLLGRREARRYYLLALAASARPLVTPRVIVTMGLIASGKSTIATRLGEYLNAPVLCADAIRKQLLGGGPTDAHHDPAFQGAYGSEVTELVYLHMQERAAHVLRSGRSVILDGSFRTRLQRDAARTLAETERAEVTFLECRCERAEAMRRLAKRAQGASVSDGRGEIYDAFAAKFEAPVELLESEHRVVDTSGPLERTLESVLARLS